MYGGGTERLDIFVVKRGDFTMFLSTGRAIYHVSQVHINSVTGRFKLHEIGVANKILFLIGQFTLWLLLCGFYFGGALRAIQRKL